MADLPVVEDSDRERAQVVSCYSCHRGMSRPPRRIDVELGTVAKESGAEAAVAHYHELVAEHADRGRYDLRPAALLDLANGFLEFQDPDGARKVLDGAFALDSEMGSAYVVLARVELASGDFDAADAALAKALEINPQDRFAGWVKSQVDQARAKANEESGAVSDETEGES